MPARTRHRAQAARLARITIGALIATASLAPPAARPAHAWVRSVTDKGTPISWPQTCTSIFADTTGTPDLPFDLVHATITRAIANWQSVTLDAGCSYLVINQGPPAASEAHYDQKNVVKFRSDKWCRPAESQNAEMCFSNAAAAITTVFFASAPGKPSDGNILDADIELNNLDFTFVIESQLPATCTSNRIADLENTLTHELGHFHGLDHTCWDHTKATAPIDNNGNPIPDCNDVLNHKVPLKQYYQVTLATMFNYAAPCEIEKRTPKADDIGAICSIYALSKSPRVCNPGANPTPSNGCSIDANPSAGPPPALVLGLGGMLLGGVLFRRRRTRAVSNNV